MLNIRHMGAAFLQLEAVSLAVVMSGPAAALRHFVGVFQQPTPSHTLAVLRPFSHGYSCRLSGCHAVPLAIDSRRSRAAITKTSFRAAPASCEFNAATHAGAVSVGAGEFGHCPNPSVERDAAQEAARRPSLPTLERIRIASAQPS